MVGATREKPLSPRARETIAGLARVLKLAPPLAYRPLRNDALRMARSCDQQLATQAEAAFAALDNNEPDAAHRAALAIVAPYRRWASQRNLLDDDGALGGVEGHLKTLALFVRHQQATPR